MNTILMLAGLAGIVYAITKLFPEWEFSKNAVKMFADLKAKFSFIATDVTPKADETKESETKDDNNTV